MIYTFIPSRQMHTSGLLVENTMSATQKQSAVINNEEAEKATVSIVQWKIAKRNEGKQ